jgi:hypothetical protein
MMRLPQRKACAGAAAAIIKTAAIAARSRFDGVLNRTSARSQEPSVARPNLR